MSGPLRSLPFTATATALATGPGFVMGARLAAGSDAATAIIRDGGATGAILAKLVASAANVADEWRPAGPVVFDTDVHVTLTGTSPQFNLFV